MPLTPEQRGRLVALLLRTPPASSYKGRTALLGDTGDLTLDRDEGNARVDLEGIVRQLDQLGAKDRLTTLIERALADVQGTAVGAELDAMLQTVKSSPPWAPVIGGVTPPWEWQKYLKISAMVLSAVGLLAVILVWRLGIPDGPGKAEPSTVIPEIKAFEPKVHGIVVGGPGAANMGQELFKRLQDLDERAVRQVPWPSGASLTELRSKTKAAGAAVLIEIAEDGQAQILPLGKTRDDLFDKLVPMDNPLTVNLKHKTVPAQVAVVVRSIARQIDPWPGEDGGPRPDYFELDTIDCPDIGSEEVPLDPIALLALFVVPRCESPDVDRRRFIKVCDPQSGYPAEACSLALLLDAELHKPDRPTLEKLLAGPAEFRLVASLKLASLDCTEGNFGDAAARVRAIRSAKPEPDPCILAGLPAIAACIMANSGDPKPEAMAETEALVIDPRCKRKRVLHSVLQRRGYWRIRQGRWEGAARDLQVVWNDEKETATGLLLAEAVLHGAKARLHQDPADADALDDIKRILVDLRDLQRLNTKQQLVRAVLQWFAAGRAHVPGAAADAKREIIELHARAGAENPLLAYEDKTLRDLVCSPETNAPVDRLGTAPVARPAGRARHECVYDVLKQGGTKDELARSLDNR